MGYRSVARSHVVCNSIGIAAEDDFFALPAELVVIHRIVVINQEGPDPGLVLLHLARLAVMLHGSSDFIREFRMPQSPQSLANTTEAAHDVVMPGLERMPFTMDLLKVPECILDILFPGDFDAFIDTRLENDKISRLEAIEKIEGQVYRADVLSLVLNNQWWIANGPVLQQSNGERILEVDLRGLGDGVVSKGRTAMACEPLEIHAVRQASKKQGLADTCAPSNDDSIDFTGGCIELVDEESSQRLITALDAREALAGSFLQPMLRNL